MVDRVGVGVVGAVWATVTSTSDKATSGSGLVCAAGAKGAEHCITRLTEQKFLQIKIVQ